MKNQNGITLATVVLTIIVIFIIISTSVIVGSRLINEAKEQKEQENNKIVLDAINREISKATTGGVISPGVYNYIGIKNPTIGRDSNDLPVNAGNDWYLLDEASLQQLGIRGLDDIFLVNYKKNAVINLHDRDLENIQQAIIEAEN